MSRAAWGVLALTILLGVNLSVRFAFAGPGAHTPAEIQIGDTLPDVQLRHGASTKHLSTLVQMHPNADEGCTAILMVSTQCGASASLLAELRREANLSTLVVFPESERPSGRAEEFAGGLEAPLHYAPTRAWRQLGVRGVPLLYLMDSDRVVRDGDLATPWLLNGTAPPGALIREMAAACSLEGAEARAGS